MRLTKVLGAAFLVIGLFLTASFYRSMTVTAPLLQAPLEGEAFQGLTLLSSIGSRGFLIKRNDPSKAVSCFWRVPEESATRVEHGMQTLTFLSAAKAANEYVQDARVAIADGRELDAQCAWAQAYLIGEKRAMAARKLVDLSAELSSWRLVKQLTQE